MLILGRRRLRARRPLTFKHSFLLVIIVIVVIVLARHVLLSVVIQIELVQVLEQRLVHLHWLVTVYELQVGIEQCLVSFEQIFTFIVLFHRSMSPKNQTYYLLIENQRTNTSWFAGTVVHARLLQVIHLLVKNELPLKETLHSHFGSLESFLLEIMCILFNDHCSTLFV